MICVDELTGNVRLPVIARTVDGLETVRVVDFDDNLTIPGAPAYVNENGRMGLKRLHHGSYDGLLVLMRYDERYPRNSYAEFITEIEAYELCRERGKLELAHELDIEYEKEREVL